MLPLSSFRSRSDMYINIASEDEISELVCERIVGHALPDYRVNLRLRKGGNGYLKSRIANFNQMAEREPVFVLTDLDTGACPSDLVTRWLRDMNVSPNLFLRVAIREIEAWLMADLEGLSTALQVDASAFTEDPETLADPKARLLQIVRQAPREIRQEMLATRGTVASQGIGYNRLLGNFVIDSWSPERAAPRSESLSRCIERLSGFHA